MSDKHGKTYSASIIQLVGEVYLPELRYSFNQEIGKGILSWKHTDRELAAEKYEIQGVTTPDYSLAVSLSNPKSIKKDPNRCGVYINVQFNEGLYVIAQGKQEDDFFGFAGFEPPRINDYCLLKIAISGTLSEAFERQLRLMLESFDERISKLFYTIIANYGDDENICEMLAKFSKDKLSDEQR
jgi:hypothetical protein